MKLRVVCALRSEHSGHYTCSHLPVSAGRVAGIRQQCLVPFELREYPARRRSGILREDQFHRQTFGKVGGPVRVTLRLMGSILGVCGVSAFLCAGGRRMGTFNQSSTTSSWNSRIATTVMRLGSKTPPPRCRDWDRDWDNHDRPALGLGRGRDLPTTTTRRRSSPPAARPTSYRSRRRAATATATSPRARLEEQDAKQ